MVLVTVLATLVLVIVVVVMLILVIVVVVTLVGLVTVTSAIFGAVMGSPRPRLTCRYECRASMYG